MNVAIKSIVPDVNQPRKYFDPSKMKTLRQSIEENGIISPLIVEKKGDQYLLVDGERRFKTAQDLKLKEVPVIVIPTTNDTDRLVRQFHIQEQHAQWTMVEKAVALNDLSTKLKMTIHDVCTMLNMSKGEQDSYVAFASLTDKVNFVKSEIGLHWTRPLQSLRNFTKNIVELELEDKFIHSDAKKLEAAMIRSIKNGSIEQSRDITKLKDAFKKNPKLVGKFINDPNSTPQDLFVEAKAKGSYYLRNLLQSSRYVTTNGRRLIENNDVTIAPAELEELVRALEVLKEVIKVIK